MPKKREITAVSYIKIDGELIPWDDLTPEKKMECSLRMMERAGKVASEHLSNHLDEAERIFGKEKLYV